MAVRWGRWTAGSSRGGLVCPGWCRSRDGILGVVAADVWLMDATMLVGVTDAVMDARSVTVLDLD